MAVYTDPFVVLGVVSFLLMAGMAAWTFRARDAPGVLSYSVLAGIVGVWSLCYVPQLLATDLAGKLFWLKLRNTLSHGVVLAWLVFALKYTGREEYLEPRYLAPVAGVSVALVIPVWVTDWFVAEAVLVRRDSLFLVDLEFGSFFWVYVLYLYAVITVGLNLLASTFLGALSIYRMQATALFLAVLLPFIGSGLYMTEHLAFLPNLNPYQDVELTPYAFGFSAVLIGWSFFNYRFLDIAPIARSKVVENMDDAVLVLDRDARIVDANGKVKDLLDRDDSLVGTSMAEAFVDYPEVADGYLDGVEEVLVEGSEGARYYEVGSSEVRDSRGRYTGDVVVLRDVTERRRRERELERQNEQLDRFASVVSHDLRNPLSVVRGYTDILREEYRDELGREPEELEKIEDGVERMEELIDQVLALARQGRTVTETSSLALDDVAETAWSHVETGDASLVIRTERVVEADEGRLLQVLENLFRNAVEHGGGDVTVRVGEVDGGFYVEDTGPGIPPEERDEVFDHGFTTAEDGTGFGLAIVENAVEAHGWRVEVRESREGGARFEVTGVTVAEEGEG